MEYILKVLIYQNISISNSGIQMKEKLLQMVTLPEHRQKLVEMIQKIEK